ncbi:unnamed protein product, partial [Mesorhabditis belari]|uniref:Uncharacterized protein n=1 Tax=Mesorhabditis belari TaxID=2138241 RepID=A0AAF3ES92_9BILA
MSKVIILCLLAVFLVQVVVSTQDDLTVFNRAEGGIRVKRGSKCKKTNILCWSHMCDRCCATGCSGVNCVDIMCGVCCR